MRVFIACLISPEAREQALAVQKVWRERVGDRVSWTKSDNLHITVKFLGEVPEERLSEIQGVLGAIAQDSQAFSANLTNPHAFPSPRRPRVLVVDVEAPALDSIAQRLEAALEPLGFPTEKRPFHGHVTVGRVREGQHIEGILPSSEPVTWSIAELVLFASTLSPGGSRYEVLGRYPLGIA